MYWFLVEPGKEKRGNKEVLFGRCVQMMSRGRFLMVGGGAEGGSGGEVGVTGAGAYPD